MLSIYFQESRKGGGEARGDKKQFYIILSTIGTFWAMDFIYSGEISHNRFNRLNTDNCIHTDKWPALPRTGHQRPLNLPDSPMRAPCSRPHNMVLADNRGIH